MNTGETRNMHELVEPQQHFKEVDQPFYLFISFEAFVLMTVHAAMHRNEVIGFVSGYRTSTRGPNQKKDVLLITDCNPCTSALFDESGGSGNVDYSRNVEMDPESA